MAWPVKSQLTSEIVQTDFYMALAAAETQRFYPRLSIQKDQDAITTTYTSLGSVPEPRQMSNVQGGGVRQGVILKDWIQTATVNEWESTIHVRKLIALSRPADVREKATQMGQKAMRSMDKTFCVALAASTPGYDGVALYSTAHPESGTNQNNDRTSAAASGTKPTAAELEAGLETDVTALKGFVDDQGTPVNEGIARFTLLVPPDFEFVARTVVSPLMSQQAIDSSGVTGKFRGLIDVIVSGWATSTGLSNGAIDRTYLFADPAGGAARALALCEMVAWEFSNNIGDESSDDWNKGLGYLRSYGVYVYAPWNWQATVRHVYT